MKFVRGRFPVMSRLRNDEGSFTLETTLVFPTIFFLTIIMILFSLTIYEKVVVYQKAHKVAERISFTWDNSMKKFETGHFEKNEYTSMPAMDGLYWRTNEIGTNFIKKALNIDIKDVRSNKINKAEKEAKEIFYIRGRSNIKSVEVDVNGGLFTGQVIVTAQSRLKLPKFMNHFVNNNFEATAVASIKDPVELIRITDFAYYYGAEILRSVFGE